MTFATITGHEQQKNILRRALSKNRIAHAYLFEGPDGIGKRLMALAFARALLCLKSTGCGDCPACRKVDHNNHPDVHLLDAEETTIKIDQVRSLQQELSLRPLEGKDKICLIDGAEQLTPGAANALLKTLEEPQPNTLIILLTSHPEKLLPTICSRCQRLPFSRLPKQQLATILCQRLDLNSTEANVLAALSDGSLKKALGQNKQLYLEKRHNLIQSLSALSSGSTIPTFSLADELATEKDLLPDILDIFQAFYRDVLLMKHGRPKEELVNLDLLESLEKQSKILSTDSLMIKLKALDSARFHLQRNVNRQLALEVMLIRMTAA
ncbi:MAG: DNA polymerase III subunit delta' [Deltaproteobacteria bacterium]|jgi:DNA polymerase-3 subunit delta'|nr:DNA polymerase III subunit delta' [Deltaproteobacteria bacterium]MCW8892614.1 DNA polymerase III subunit delta' [Deltaproteobacteria bacterium]